jgi:hypothetical protein
MSENGRDATDEVPSSPGIRKQHRVRYTPFRRRNPSAPRSEYNACSFVVCPVQLHNGASPARPCQTDGQGLVNDYPGGTAVLQGQAPRINETGNAGGHSNVILKSDGYLLIYRKNKRNTGTPSEDIYPSEPKAPRARQASTLAALAASTDPIRPPSDSSHGADEQTASSGLSLPSPDDCFSWHVTATVPGSASPS